MRYDPTRYPHPDGLRSCRWDVHRETVPLDERFGSKAQDVTVWVAKPLPRRGFPSGPLRLERMSFNNRDTAIRYATDQARREQLEAYLHHTHKEPS